MSEADRETNLETNPETNLSAKRRPVPGLTLIAWLLGAAAAFFALFWLLGAGMRFLPEPIGSRADLFVDGARITLQLTVVSGLIGLALGTLAGIARASSFWLAQAPAAFYVWLFRGTPLLVQILFVYNALPLILQGVGLDVQINEFWSAVIALSLNVGAYNAEVVRAGIQALPRGQVEAARSLGLSGAQTMREVVLPQALRITVPPLVNNVVALLKDSSLASVIALTELTLAGQRVSSETFEPVPVLITVAAVYLTLTTVLTLFTGVLERRLKVGGTR